MAWLSEQPTKIVRATTAPAGRLLLMRSYDAPVLVISTDHHDGDDTPNYYHLLVSNVANFQGLVYKSSLQQWAWDITDSVVLKPDHARFSVTDDEAAPGTIAVDPGGKLHIAYRAGMSTNLWLGLSDLKPSAPTQRVHLQHWALVLRSDERVTLFKWPQD